MSKHRAKSKRIKKRNPEKVVMDRYYHPKVFRRSKRTLEAQEIDREITDYLKGEV